MFANPNLAPLSAEIFLLTMACVVMVVDLFQKDKQRRLTLWLSQASLFVTLFLTMQFYGTEKTVLYDGFWVVDNLSIILKSAILIVAMAALAYAPNYINERKFLRGEYYMLALFAVLGMLVMVSAHNLLVIYLGLELLSLPLYAMVAMERDNPKASEAAIKYFTVVWRDPGNWFAGLFRRIDKIERAVPDDQVWRCVYCRRSCIQTGCGAIPYVVAGRVPWCAHLGDAFHGLGTENCCLRNVDALVG